ncbi:tetratricopeptide repeat protein [Rhabdochlamydiaceae symbiont of Dictyostelium giganteum]|uniref:tetratricopeptide repeat protein n=1 Tax=Rhabdochlamydiaceae symbiont of Dictyostelium giganteum TaxID=3342349 RepID=UPI00384ACE35
MAILPVRSSLEWGNIPVLSQGFTTYPSHFGSSFLEQTKSLKQQAVQSVQVEQITELLRKSGIDEKTLKIILNESQNNLEALTDHLFDVILKHHETLDWDQYSQDLLLKMQDSRGMNIFFVAIREGNSSCVRQLIQTLGANALTHLKSCDQKTALHIAAIYGREDLIDDLVRLGLVSCYDEDQDKLIPLYWAIHEGHVKTVEKLLEITSLGREWIPYPSLRIPVIALAIVSGYAEVLSLLLKHNVFKEISLLDISSSWGTVLHLAIQSNQSHMLQYLLEEEHHDTALLLESKDRGGRTPLQLAAFLGDLFAIMQLTSKEALCHQGEFNPLGTPLHFAVQGEKPEAVSLLLSLGVNPSAVDDQGKTPLAHLQEKELSPSARRCKNIIENFQKMGKIEKTQPVNFQQRPPLNLILEGSYDEKELFLEAVKVLEAKKITGQLRRVAGQGMGSLVMTLFALGYSASQLEDHLPFSFEDLFDLKKELSEQELSHLKNFYSKLLSSSSSIQDIPIEGMGDLSLLKDKLETCIFDKTGKAYFTFGDLAEEVKKHPLDYKHLHLVAFGLKDQKIAHFSSENALYKDVIIADVLIATLAFPGILSPIGLRVRNAEGAPHEDPNYGRWMASSLKNSLIEIFDEHAYQEDPYFKGRQTNRRTLGVHFGGKKEGVEKREEPQDLSQQELFKKLLTFYRNQALTPQISSDRAQGRLIDIRYEDTDEGTGVLKASALTQKLLEKFVCSLKEIEPSKEVLLKGSVEDPIRPWKYQIFLHALEETPTLKKSLNKIHYCNIPLPSHLFTGRKKELKEIKEAFLHHSKVAISGMGGVGKTTLGIQYGFQYQKNYGLTAFIKAMSKVSMIQSLLEISYSLGIEKEHQDKVLSQLKGHLQMQKDPYLFIIDGLDDPDLFAIFNNYIPSTPLCNILVSTRLFFDMTKRGFHLISLDGFSEEEAVSYLFKAASQVVSDKNVFFAKQLASSLGYLPLALTHAARYIFQTPHISFKAYNALFQKHHLKILDQKEIGLIQEEKEQSILTTWNISIESIKKQNRGILASQLMQMISLLAEEKIPLSLLVHWTLKDLNEDELSFNGAVTLLLNYSLLAKQTDAEEDFICYRVHPLVQQVMRESLTQDLKEQSITKILEVFLDIIKALKKKQKYSRKVLITYALHMQHIVDLELFKEQVHPSLQIGVFNELGDIYFYLGAFENSLNIWTFALKKRVEMHGEESLQVAESYQIIGMVLQNLGKVEEALEKSTQALKITKKILGQDSPYTAECYQLVAQMLQELGKFEEALKKSTKALEINRRVLGEDSSYTTRCYQGKARILWLVGRFEEALEKSTKALEINRRVLGEDSLETAASYQAMETILYDLGKPEEALEKSIKALEINRRVLGEENLITAISYASVARILLSLKRIEEAFEKSLRALEINQSLLGDEARLTVESYQGVAKILLSLGRLEEAFEKSSKALEITTSVLGDHNPYTAECYPLVVDILQRMGRLDEALTKSVKAVEIYSSTLGENSLSTAKGYEDLAEILHKLGKGEEALKKSHQALEIKRKILGEGSLPVARSYHLEARILQDRGRLEEALTNSLKALNIHKNIMGENSPYTAGCYQGVAEILHKLGRLDEALIKSHQALEIKKEVLGEDSTFTTTGYLLEAKILQDLGRLDEALIKSHQALEIQRHVVGDHSLYLTRCYQGIAQILRKQGRLEEALEISLKVLENTRQILGESSIYTAECYQSIVEILRELKRYEEALEKNTKALEIKRSVFGEGTLSTVTHYQLEAKIFQDLGRYEEALERRRKILDINKSTLGEYSPYTARSYRGISKTLECLGKLEEAFQNSLKALEINQKVLGDHSIYTAKCYKRISLVLKQLGRDEEATEKSKKGLKIQVCIGGEGAIRTAKYYTSLAKILYEQHQFREALAFALKGVELKEKKFLDYSLFKNQDYLIVIKILTALKQDGKAALYQEKERQLKEKFHFSSSNPSCTPIR